MCVFDRSAGSRSFFKYHNVHKKLNHLQSPMFSVNSLEYNKNLGVINRALSCFSNIFKDNQNILSITNPAVLILTVPSPKSHTKSWLLNIYPAIFGGHGRWWYYFDSFFCSDVISSRSKRIFKGIAVRMENAASIHDHQACFGNACRLFKPMSRPLGVIFGTHCCFAPR